MKLEYYLYSEIDERGRFPILEAVKRKEQEEANRRAYEEWYHLEMEKDMDDMFMSLLDSDCNYDRNECEY